MKKMITSGSFARVLMAMAVLVPGVRGGEGDRDEGGGGSGQTGADGAPVENTPLTVGITHGPNREALEFFAAYLSRELGARIVWVSVEKAGRKGDRFRVTPVQGISELQHCDVILSNLHRTCATPVELRILKRIFTTKPVVGLRRSHHGFQNWMEADHEVFGVRFGSDYKGEDVRLVLAGEAGENTIVKGFTPDNPESGIYKHFDPEPDVIPLIVGSPAGKPVHPQTWIRVVKRADDLEQRVFYTRYGPDDLRRPGVRDMVVRAILWAVGRESLVAVAPTPPD